MTLFPTIYTLGLAPLPAIHPAFWLVLHLDRISPVLQWEDQPFEVIPRTAEVRVVISKAKWFAHSIVWLAVASGFFIGGRAGVAVSVLSFTVGLGLLGTHLTISRRGNHAQQAPPVSKQATEVLVIVKEAHAYNGSGQNPESVTDSKQANSELDVFLRVWLVSESETEVAIKSCQLKIAASGGQTRTEEPTLGNLENWHIDTDKEETDLWDTHIERVREPLEELNTSGALECGAPREGWLHFRFRDVTPSDYKAASMELLVEDTLSVTNVATVDCPRYLSGKVERNELGDPPHISPAA